MKPGDILMWQDEKFGKHHFWRIEGVYLGYEGQESLIELRNLTEKPGAPSGTSTSLTTFVPEPLVRNLTIYTPDIQKVGDNNDRLLVSGPGIPIGH